MRISDKAIVLQSIRHGDKKVILKIFTANHGLLTVITSTGKTATSKVKTGTIQLLNILEVELILKQNKEIHQLTEASCYYAHTGISGSFSKLSIAQFLNEILLKSLKEQSSNQHLFDFIETCFTFLSDSEENYINLHLYFLLELSRYLGFGPQNNHNKADSFFDIREGRFSNNELPFPLGLSDSDSELFSGFLKQDILKTEYSGAQRQNLIEILLAYYRLHIPGFNEVKSLEVLREISH